MIARPYEAMQCPACKKWIYVAGGPFECGTDTTKPLADAEHWFAEHAEPSNAIARSFPLFDYNEEPVEIL